MSDVATAAIAVSDAAVALVPHSARRATAAARQAKRAQATKILGGVGKPKHRRDSVSDRQHALLKQSAARFFVRDPPST